jgi:hypothetical protein
MGSRSETCRLLYQNKFEKWRISLAFVIRIYHDARSSECQTPYDYALYLYYLIKLFTLCYLIDCKTGVAIRLLKV